MKQTHSGIIAAVRNLERSTIVGISAVTQVRRAFTLGLWYKSFPNYMLEHLETLYTWDLKEIDPEASKGFDAPDNGFKFQFISDTGDSWHEVYRDLRQRGWKRLKVHRDGGRLQYLFNIENTFGYMPEGFRELHLLLDISIRTCKQIQVGTEMKEIPVIKTVCEDLVELAEDERVEFQAAADTNPTNPDTGLEEPRCDHGNLSGCCSQSDCLHFMGHDEPEPSTVEPRNINEDGIPF